MSLGKRNIRPAIALGLTALLSLSVLAPSYAESRPEASQAEIMSMRGALGPLVMVWGTNQVITPKSRWIPSSVLGPLKRYKGSSSVNGSEILVVSGSKGSSAFEIWKEQTGRADATTEDFIASLIVSGPQGPRGVRGLVGFQGAIGAAGVSGPQGEKGEDGITTTVEVDGEPGKDGEDGSSAYELWKEKCEADGAADCSEDTFWESLLGEQGEAGENGQDGLGTLKLGQMTCPNNQKVTSLTLQNIEGNYTLGVQCKDNGPNNARESENGNWDPAFDDGVETQDANELFNAWKSVNKKPNASLEEFVDAMKGSAGKDAYTLWRENQIEASGNRGNSGKSLELADFFEAMRGSQGEKGEKGERGEQGLQGLAGPQGPAGPQGVAGSSAFEVWKSTVNRPNASVSDFLTSITGAQGPIGAAGVQGPSGAPGKNNFELWKESLAPNNKNNSFADFLLAVSGPKGDKGDRGEQGIQGLTGATGSIGLTGAQGPVGPQGVPGIQGIQGVRGEKGERGDQGVPGVAGPVGPQGPKGKDGAMALAIGSCEVGQVIQSLTLNDDGAIEASCVTAAPTLGEAAICVAPNGTITWGACSKGGETYFLARLN